MLEDSAPFIVAVSAASGASIKKFNTLSKNLAATMVMKLYGFVPLTPNVERAVLPLFLAEVDIEKEVEFVHVNFKNKQTKSPAYKSKNPFGKLPLLEDGDVTIFESRAIAKYIAEKYQDKQPSLLGNSLQERVVINAWIESDGHNLRPIVAPAIREFIVEKVFKIPANLERIASRLPDPNAMMDVYEAHLSKNKYLAGENYTMADAFHTPFMWWVHTEEVFKHALDNRPHVAAWIAAITSHPAYEKCRQVNFGKATPFQA